MSRTNNFLFCSFCNSNAILLRKKTRTQVIIVISYRLLILLVPFLEQEVNPLPLPLLMACTKTPEESLWKCSGTKTDEHETWLLWDHICMLLTMQIYLADNANMDPVNTFSELWSPIKEMNDRCIKFKSNEKNISALINQSVVPYFIHHRCKQFICGQIIPFSFNLLMWCHIFFSWQVSAISWANAKTIIMRNSVRAHLILQFSETLVQAHPGQYHLVFFLTFFTSIAFKFGYLLFNRT